MQGDMMESINLFCSFHLLKPSDLNSEYNMKNL